jgi:nitrite reductase (cytochrome c-552)
MMDYATAHGELEKTPDGTHGEIGAAHPVGCIDCHDPRSMQVRVTRPGFVEGIAAFAAGEAPAPHLPSVERWRAGKREKPYDPNLDASRQEMRAFVCAQCHVEYYCGSKMALTFPWSKGLKAEDIEAFWDEQKFADGSEFFDYEHAETGAPVYKAQHPEFELWSQGVHARSGVACADCHMPYQRQGAMKVSSHWVRSPLLNINSACQTCHNVPEDELRDRVATIQDRTRSQLDRAAAAMTDMLDAIDEAQAAGATPEQLAPILKLQRQAMWRLDFISSENSMGFHAPQEAVRVLGESIDYSRQAQVAALRLRIPAAETPN